MGSNWCNPDEISLLQVDVRGLASTVKNDAPTGADKTDAPQESLLQATESHTRVQMQKTGKAEKAGSHAKVQTQKTAKVQKTVSHAKAQTQKSAKAQKTASHARERGKLWEKIAAARAKSAAQAKGAAKKKLLQKSHAASAAAKSAKAQKTASHARE